jgi:hypothetical protein
VGPKWKPKNKDRTSGTKRKEELPFKEIPKRNNSAGAGSSGVPRSRPAATRVPAVEISANG